MKQITIFLFAAMLLASCTENQKVKKWGGTMTINLPAGEKLVNVTWKDNNEWTLTRKMNASDSAETYTFHEKSDYGIQEGTIIFIEHK